MLVVDRVELHTASIFDHRNEGQKFDTYDSYDMAHIIWAQS